MSQRTIIITGRVYVVGDDVSADDVLGPDYLSFDPADPDERRFLGAYAFADLVDRFGAFVEPGRFKSDYSIVLAGRRFGHGSARPQTAIALAEAGVRAVIATSFGEGFHRTAINEGLLYPLVAVDGAIEGLTTGDEATIDLDAGTMTAGERVLILEPMGVAREIVDAGGLLAHAARGLRTS